MHGAVVIDADALAREALAAGSPGLARVVEHFGRDVLADDGSLDRAALARRVFNDAAERAELEAIVHPIVRRRSAELAAAAGHPSIVVHDVPLLVESSLQDEYDVVVVVDAPDPVRVQRLVESRGLSVEDARSRMTSQADRLTRLAVADLVVVNDGSEEDLGIAVEKLWHTLQSWPRARTSQHARPQ
jgi:dephospho-CoA kinase